MLQNDRMNFLHNRLIGYLNINSFRNKVIDLGEILKDLPLDYLVISETKLDESFSNSQLKLDGYFFFYLGFLSRTFTIHRTAGEGGGYLFNSSLPLAPASQTLRHKPRHYCRELTSAHNEQPDSNQEPLFSERKPLTTKLRALKVTLAQERCI